MIRFLAFLVTLGGPASAEAFRVYTGEHGDFTRLVVEIPVGAEWTVGRTPMGYAFDTNSASPINYDLSTVWDRIAKDRLRAIKTDPRTGAILLSLGCDCHVIPFEYRPGIIVLDVKPGPAPPGSLYQKDFLPIRSSEPERQTIDEDLHGYDWLDLVQDLDSAPEFAMNPFAPTIVPSVDFLREELLRQISQGAAAGLVDMKISPEGPEVGGTEGGDLPWVQISIGPPSDTIIGSNPDVRDRRTPDGQACIPDDLIALPDWGRADQLSQLLAEARVGIFGEFDALDVERTVQAARSHLYLGFGAEAGQYADLLPDDEKTNLPEILRSMARLVDGDRDPDSPFLGMLGCDGAAALWAALAAGEIPPSATVNADAIARSFLALPSHLRSALGPDLAESLLDHGSTEAARIIRNAVARTPETTGAVVDLMDAKVGLHGDRPESAFDHAEAAVAADGRNVEEWIALVEAHFRKGEPLSTEAVEALRAFAGSIESPDLERDFVRALALAEILSGQSEAAFLTAKQEDVPRTDLWKAAVVWTEDETFLRQAVIDPVDAVSATVAVDIARRLSQLGFPDAARAWLGPTAQGDGPEKRRVAAQVAFALGDARQTISLLDGLTAPEDEALRARAFVQIGRIADARAAYRAAGNEDEASRLAAWDRSWSELQDEDSPWAAVVSAVEKASPAPPGPLSQGSAALTASSASRAAIETLLASVPGPDSFPR